MIAALLIAASVLVAVVALVVHLAPFPRWPAQAERSWCARCHASFRGDRGLSLHVGAMHPETYDAAERAQDFGSCLLGLASPSSTGPAKPIHSGLAQSAEHGVLNAVGGGSSPSPRTMPVRRREGVGS